MSLLDLKENQVFILEKKKYEVINMVKYKEKSSHWFEYKIRSLDSGKYYHLNVELSFRIVLYEILDDEKVDLGLNVKFRDEEYEIFENGTGKVDTYYGITDVALNDIVTYYEYKSKSNNNKILSNEKCANKTEVSLGRVISLLDIN